MIYLDTSVALAYLFAEDRHPADAFFEQRLIASRLLEYELFTVLAARGYHASHRAVAERLLRRVALVELERPMLERALQPFPTAVRTLDALHLATCAYLRAVGHTPMIASYDSRLLECARALGLEVVEP